MSDVKRHPGGAVMHAAGISGAGKDRDQRFGWARGIETSGQGVGNVDDKNQPRYRALGHTEHTAQHFAYIEHTSARSMF
jgi:hypothetical protein